MKSERAFATFRVAGDNLDPALLTKLVGVQPTLAYSKGQRYKISPRSPHLKGRTGVWLLSTDQEVQSDRLSDHLKWLSKIIEPNKMKLKRFIERNSLHAVMTCFWHGPAGTVPPSVSPETLRMLEAIPAELETDFDTDDQVSRPSIPVHTR